MPFFNFRRGGSNAASNAGPAAQPESVEVMRKRAKHRLIGSAVLVLIGVVGFPLLFDTQPRPIPVDIPIEIPGKGTVKPLAVPPAPTAVAPAPAAPAPTPPAPADKVAAAASLAPKEEILPSKPAAAASAPAAVKPEAKPEVKPAPKPEPKPAAKPEPKPVANADAASRHCGGFAGALDGRQYPARRHLQHPFVPRSGAAGRGQGRDPR